MFRLVSLALLAISSQAIKLENANTNAEVKTLAQVNSSMGLDEGSKKEILSKKHKKGEVWGNILSNLHQATLDAPA